VVRGQSVVRKDSQWLERIVIDWLERIASG